MKPPDTHHLKAAEGWLELGNAVEARVELEQIAPAFHGHPEVLEVRWGIAAKAKDWQGCVEIASALVKKAPKNPSGWIHRSYALHELKRTVQALDELLPAAAKFPKEWVIPYNLACYCTRLGRLEEARGWLEAAFKLGDRARLKEMALADPDLEMIWRGF
jgi:Flp pilus assembly protein TadD